MRPTVAAKHRDQGSPARPRQSCLSIDHDMKERRYHDGTHALGTKLLLSVVVNAVGMSFCVTFERSRLAKKGVLGWIDHCGGIHLSTTQYRRTSGRNHTQALNTWNRAKTTPIANTIHKYPSMGDDDDGVGAMDSVETLQLVEESEPKIGSTMTPTTAGEAAVPSHARGLRPNAMAVSSAAM